MSCNLTYNLSITGDCSNTNSGSFSLEIIGTAPDYTIQWISPASYGTISLGPGITGYTVDNLSAATYTFNVIDSCEPNTIQPINVYISSGTCVTISGFEDTLCGEDNGSISATTTNFYGLASFYLYDNVYGFITSGTSISNEYLFNGLSASTYYVIANDGGGCTGSSESVIIKDSNTVDFGLYIVNDAGCAVDSGKIYITGLTGNPPYTYLWSNGETTSSITGLSEGSYSVTVTDDSGCEVTKNGYVSVVPPIGIVAVFTTGPDCFDSNGEVTVVVTGGTGPYFYSGSTSTNNGPSFDTEYTFTNLGSGIFDIRVTDAGLCNDTTSTFLTTPGGFSVVSITTTNSTCSNSGGSIGINLFGGTTPYVYTLSLSGGSTTSQTTNSSTWSFNNLISGTYTLTISDGGPCVFTDTYEILNEPLYNLEVFTTGTTCNSENGIVTISVSGGSPSYTYTLDGVQTITTASTETTFFGLSSGSHTINVVDGSSCSQDIIFSIDSSTDVDFVLTSTDAIGGDNGTVSAFITSGEPPFNLTWSPNVNGQTGYTVNNLSAGTYTLTVVDDNGCESTSSVIVNGDVLLSSYQVYNVCDSDLTNYGEIILKGPKQMLLDGFYSLTSDDENCVLNQSIFEAVVELSGVTKTEQFFTGSTLNEYPTIEQWDNVIKEILLTYDGIGSVNFDIDKNTMTILTDCNSEISLIDVGVIINMTIYYDISCVSCNDCCLITNIVKCNECSLTPIDFLLETFINGIDEPVNSGYTTTIIPSGIINGFNSFEFTLGGINCLLFHEDGVWYLIDDDTSAVYASLESNSKCPESSEWTILDDILSSFTTVKGTCVIM